MGLDSTYYDLSEPLVGGGWLIGYGPARLARERDEVVQDGLDEARRWTSDPEALRQAALRAARAFEGAHREVRTADILSVMARQLVEESTELSVQGVIRYLTGRNIRGLGWRSARNRIDRCHVIILSWYPEVQHWSEPPNEEMTAKWASLFIAHHGATMVLPCYACMDQTMSRPSTAEIELLVA